MANTQPVFSRDFSAITSIGSIVNPCADTAAFFDRNYTEAPLSAIDLYIENCKEITKLWFGQDSISPEFSRLLLLGYLSAVESYLRAVLRGIINADAKTRSDSHSYMISFGAALFHEKSALAESLLEAYSFSSEKEVKKAFEKFLEIPPNSESIKPILAEFEKLCQMRHCCVHRFGKLGTLNAIALGLAAHSKSLEKPLVLDASSLADVASWLMSFAKVLNNFLFRTLLERSVNTKNPFRTDWKWVYSKDRGKFEKMYKLFATTRDGTPSPTSKELYERFKLSRGAVATASRGP